MRKQSGPGVKTPGPPAFCPFPVPAFALVYDRLRCDPLRAMSKITGVWKRALQPLLLTAVRRQLGLGVPTPRTDTTIAAMAAAGRCESVRLDDLPRQALPPHGISGDLAAVAHVRSLIDNPVAREQYDRLLRGIVIQPAVQSFVAVMTDGCVTHDAGIVMAGGDAVLEDVSGLGFADDTPTNSLKLSHLPRPRRTPHSVAVLTTGPNHNYYHWLTEAVPRLDLYERSGLRIDRFYAPIRHRFQREALALLGIPHERIVPATCHAHLAPDSLVVSSCHGGLSRTKTDFLFRRLAAHVGPWAGPGRRVFISRGSRGVRAIANEREVLRALRPLGFERHRLEGMPLAEQIAVFSRADCVVGPHGAGLTNLTFCRPRTKVVEIGTPYRPWACFYEIAHHRGLDYHLHMASPVHVRHFNPQTAVGDSNLRVDPTGLRDVVEAMISGRSGLSERVA